MPPPSSCWGKTEKRGLYLCRHLGSPFQFSLRLLLLIVVASSTESAGRAGKRTEVNKGDGHNTQCRFRRLINIIHFSVYLAPIVWPLMRHWCDALCMVDAYGLCMVSYIFYGVITLCSTVMSDDTIDRPSQPKLRQPAATASLQLAS